MKTKSIIAIGRACSLVQAMPNRIEAAARELGIEPALRINLVPHYAESDINRIGEYLNQQKQRPIAARSNS
jgi:hypothetical protein